MCSVALACVAGVKRGGGRGGGREFGQKTEDQGRFFSFPPPLPPPLYTPVTQAMLPYGFNPRNVGCGTLERKQRASRREMPQTAGDFEVLQSDCSFSVVMVLHGH